MAWHTVVDLLVTSGLMLGRRDGLLSKGMLFLEVSNFKETMCACSFSCLKISNNRVGLLALGVDGTLSLFAKDNYVCFGFQPPLVFCC